MSRLADKTIRSPEEAGITSLNADFLPKEFRSAIENHGYRCVYEAAFICPCRDKHSDHLNTCKNCGGSGWLFVNPVYQNFIITSVSLDKKYQDIARVDLGMMFVTPQSDLKLSQMDRITVIDGDSAHSEVLFPEIDDITGNFFCFSHYDIKNIIWIGLFLGVNNKIQRLSVNEDFTFSNNIVFLDNKFNHLKNPQISIRYIHSPQFHVWDIVNDIRNVKVQTAGLGRKNTVLPMRAIAKRSHLISDLENFEGDRLFDNSWKITNMKCDQTDQTTEQDRIIRYTDVDKLFNTMTSLQRIQIKPYFERVISMPEELTITMPEINVTTA